MHLPCKNPQHLHQGQKDPGAMEVLIHKKGDIESVGNWRPIALCSTLYKLLTCCLVSRLSAWITNENMLSSAQKDFLPFDGTFEHHYLVSTEILCTKTQGEELCKAQIDLANVFGSVPHAAIDAALQAAIDAALQAAIDAALHAAGADNTFAEIKRRPVGVPLSGPIFNLAIDPLIRGLHHASPSSGDEYSVLASEDDLLLLAKSPEDLQALLPTFTQRLGSPLTSPNTGQSICLGPPLHLFLHQSPTPRSRP
ncbi:hypothetical protein JTE90_018211 [Oedothorax gibbosus]|uniref:Reverse transcriptase domain-containing protein n=1 Tax=Oedothorax gibbosus TaxID=931172 RepID=A0AAV6U9R5_9ARAC|nr:hypothetical protein JTE90_018211 [Oedothorax gibbosus]